MLGLMLSHCYPLEDSQILLVDGTSSLLLSALATRTGENTSIHVLQATVKMPGQNKMRCFRQMNISIEQYNRFDFKAHEGFYAELQKGTIKATYTQ